MQTFYVPFVVNIPIIVYLCRGGSRAAATSKMESFVIIAFQPLTIITKRSILDVATALDPPLLCLLYMFVFIVFIYLYIFINTQIIKNTRINTQIISNVNKRGTHFLFLFNSTADYLLILAFSKDL